MKQTITIEITNEEYYAFGHALVQLKQHPAFKGGIELR